MKRFYPLGDRLKLQDWEKLNLSHIDFDARVKIKQNIRAVTTGEFRQVQEGEWYLSGAVVEAYRWHSGERSKDKFHIARLVLTKTITTVTIVEDE